MWQIPVLKIHVSKPRTELHGKEGTEHTRGP